MNLAHIYWIAAYCFWRDALSGAWMLEPRPRKPRAKA